MIIRAFALFLIITSFGLHGLPLFAQETATETDYFKEALQAYIGLRALEEELTLSSYTEEEEETRQIQQDTLSAQITAKKVELFTMLDMDANKYTSWQQTIIQAWRKKESLPSANKSAVDYMILNFKDAAQFSVLEWKAIREWFGEKNQKAFLRLVYSPQKDSPLLAAKKVLLIVDPYRKLLHRPNSLEASLRKKLTKLGYQVETHEINAYAKTEEQAEALYRSLQRIIKEPTILITSQEASGILYKTIDLHSDIRRWENISGWFNIQGRLYGLNPVEHKLSPKASRSIASTSDKPAQDPSAKWENNIKQELYSLHKETLMRPTPMGDGFPIISILSLDDGIDIDPSEQLVQGSQGYFTKDYEKELLSLLSIKAN